MLDSDVKNGFFSRSLTLWIFLCLFILTQWSSSVYLPIIPELLKLFSSNQQIIIASLSWFFFGYAVGQLFWGTLSDYICRYSTLIISLFVYCIFELLIVLTHQAVIFIIFLSITGFAIAANTSVGNALIKDFYKEKSKVIIGYVGIAMAFAPVIAPIIGTHLYALSGWKAIFLFLFLLGAFMLLLFNFCLKRKMDRPLNFQKKISSDCSVSVFIMVKSTLSDKLFISYVLILSIAFGIFFSFLLIVPFWLSSLGNFQVKEVGYFMFFLTSTYIVGAILNVILLRSKSAFFIVNLGLIFILAGSAVLIMNYIFFHELMLLSNIFALAFVMLGIGVVLPASKTGAMLSRKHYIGTAASVMKFVQTLGPVILTRITAFCISNGNNTFFCAVLVIAMLLTISFAILLALAERSS